jgi:hypothetical protein
MPNRDQSVKSRRHKHLRGNLTVTLKLPTGNLYGHGSTA